MPSWTSAAGHAVPYQAGAGEFDLSGFAHRVRSALSLECSRHGIPRPRLTVEPGRAIVGRAGVTVYRVAVVKQVGDGRRIVAMDGGMSDNPLPLRTARGTRYGSSAARWTPRCAPPPWSAGTASPGICWPRTCPCPRTCSMASNSNLVGRPPVMALADSQAALLVRRETKEDLLRRDVG